MTNKKRSGRDSGLKDAFADFFENPTRESFRQFLTDNLGESRSVDFKQEWLKPHEIEKKLLGFANTGDGCLVFGVAEEDDGALNPVGLATLEDKADVQNRLRKFLPSDLMERITTYDLSYKSSEYETIKGKKFQVLIVDYDAKFVPHTAIKDTIDLKSTAIYVRRDGLTIEANHNELQNVLSARIETGYSTSRIVDMRKDLDDLKALYHQLPSRFYRQLFTTQATFGRGADTNGGTYEEFINEMISLKKAKIRAGLGL